MTNDPPRLDQINLVVGDVAAAVAFYQLLGVEVDDPPPPWDAHHRTLSAGDDIDLEIDSSRFAERWNQGWPPGAAGAVVGFRVEARETVDEIYERLVGAGHTGQQPPFDAFWGARYALVADPSGTTVGIMSAADPARRSPPPDPV